MKPPRTLVWISVVLVTLILCGNAHADRLPQDLTFSASAPTGKPARVLKSMKLQTSGDSVVATVEGDGVLLYAVYVIQSPPKIIADFLEVKNQLGTQTLPKPNAFFQRVRAYEYPGNPGSKEVRDKAYSRIVFDLNKLVAYRISPDGNKIKIELIPIVEQDAKASQDSKVSEDTKTQEDPKAQQDAKTQQDTKTEKNAQPQQDTQVVQDTQATQSAPPPPSSVPPKVAAPSLSPSDNFLAGHLEPPDIDPQLFFRGAAQETNEYQLGPEDVIQISVFQLQELNVTSRVTGSGTITLPLIGILKVQGLTANQVGDQIAKLLGDKYLQNPQVTVNVSEFNSQKISVIGQVKSPGSVALLGPRTIIQLIAQVGGLADPLCKNIFVFRQAPDGRSARLRISVEDLLVKGDPKWNIWLKSGDVISVPSVGEVNVTVLGAVGTPGIYALPAGDNATLITVIARAGGLKGASKSGIKIKRRDASGHETTLEANYGDIIAGKKPDIPLMDGDVIIVKESFF